MCRSPPLQTARQDATTRPPAGTSHASSRRPRSVAIPPPVEPPSQPSAPSVEAPGQCSFSRRSAATVSSRRFRSRLAGTARSSTRFRLTGKLTTGLPATRLARGTHGRRGHHPARRCDGPASHNLQGGATVGIASLRASLRRLSREEGHVPSYARIVGRRAASTGRRNAPAFAPKQESCPPGLRSQQVSTPLRRQMNGKATGWVVRRRRGPALLRRHTSDPLHEPLVDVVALVGKPDPRAQS